MRKSLVLLNCIVLLLTLCSCKKSEVSPKVFGISFVADISYNGERYECETVIEDSKKTTLTVTSPEDIKGLVVTVDGDKKTAEFMGLCYSPKEDNPICALAQNILDIMSDISLGGKTAELGDKNCVIKGSKNKKDYIFTFSPAGLPLSLNIPDSDIEAVFKNVTQI